MEKLELLGTCKRGRVQLTTSDYKLPLLHLHPTHPLFKEWTGEQYCTLSHTIALDVFDYLYSKELFYIGSVHWREEGCIGKYTPRGPRDFPKAGILHPEAREIARGRSPREISRAEGGVFSNASRLEAVYGHSFIIIREVLIFWCDNRWRCYLSCFVWKRTF